MIRIFKNPVFTLKALTSHLPKTRRVYVAIMEKLDNEVGTPVATMAPRHVERLNALAGTVGRNVVVPFMLLLRLASFFR